MMFRLMLVLVLLSSGTLYGQKRVPFPKAGQLPQVPQGFNISVFAGEPLIYKPTAICFDARGRVIVGQGPQYHLSQSIKKSDSVVILIDSDKDGVADRRKVFATGLNSIQGLAWKGRDLYIANSPELTVVRDLNGDDVADEYIVVYTDLGNHEHALHGLVFGPDGRLYMSKGNSKGHNQPKKYGRVAPKAFRELWDVKHPPGAADIPPPRKFTAATYRKTYHDPHDDWGRQGGVLRCEPLGRGLEIVSRGMRNPWDLAIDSGFNLLGTDNDQTQGDRIIMPFYGAHFGWGHRYSSHWTGKSHLPTVPISGPMTSGSWAGIAYYDHPEFPANYRDAFFINDWLFGTYVFRPGWKGALRSSADGVLEPFIRRKPGGMIYRPTDLAVGPEGAIYTLGWGSNYHYEPGTDGSWVFRVTHRGPTPKKKFSGTGNLQKQEIGDLVRDLDAGTLPARRVNAQDELVKRGRSILPALIQRVDARQLTRSQQTWCVWAVGRMTKDSRIDAALIRWITSKATQNDRNLRIQSIRVLGDRGKRWSKSQPLAAIANRTLDDADPRIRFATVQAIHQARLKALVPKLLARLGSESDRVTFYAGWQALRDLLTPAELKRLLIDSKPRVRLAALLALQEDFRITLDEVLAHVEREKDPDVQSWALTFALNPTPPPKLVNTTLRIEMEQTFPVAKVIERAGQAKRGSVRRLYLQMIGRASVREGKQQQQLLTFYRTLKNDAERRLILPAAATTMAAFPDLWRGLNSPTLEAAAIEGIGNLHSLYVRQLNSNEGAVQATKKSLSFGQAFAEELAGRLLVNWRTNEVSPSARRAILQAIHTLPLPKNWRPAEAHVSLLATSLSSSRDDRLTRSLLRLLLKVEANRVKKNPTIMTKLTALSRTPSAFLYRDLLALKGHLTAEFNVVKPVAATSAAVIAKVKSGNANQGKAIFFDRLSGGCAQCHRVNGQGSSLAPDLSGVGIRLKPKDLVKSILQPSAAITEGYAMYQILTGGGRTYQGAIVRETPATLTLLQTDGQQVRLRKANIDSRQRLKKSVMPSGYELMGTQQLADLTAWLLSLRTK